MRRRRILTPIALAVALVAVACTGGGQPPTPTGPSADPNSTGGTLRIATLRYGTEILDPTTYRGGGLPNEFFRCCLLRTLLSYNGSTADEGGSVLQPDLAEGMPEVSSDGSWDVPAKQGPYYAPFQDTEVVAVTSSGRFEANAK
jgi:ABC-type transport system substrate-binding protein